jgi:hypothetical protein
MDTKIDGKRRNVLMDASSAIILFKSGLFEAVIAYYCVLMPGSVYMELTRGNHTGTEEFIKYRKDDRIRVASAEGNQIRIQEDAALPRLDDGEKDTINLFYRGAGTLVLLDDGKGAAYCRNKTIPYINALLVPRVLRLAGILSATDCEESMKRIAGFGRYSKKVIDYAFTCTDESLSEFL